MLRVGSVQPEHGAVVHVDGEQRASRPNHGQREALVKEAPDLDARADRGEGRLPDHLVRRGLHFGLAE
eukprot:9423024-Lingulodinium_polyedra.AAC.1